MRYCCFHHENKLQYGLIESVAGHDQVTHLLSDPPETHGRVDTQNATAISALPLDAIKLLAPVHPSKIACVGRNYRAHAAEMGNESPKEPLIFLKPPSSIIASGENIVLPRESRHTDYEGELGVIIGRRCSKPRADEDMRNYILGYTIVNDFTARDLQRNDAQWTRGKGFDTFCPVGPIVSDDLDPWHGIRVRTLVNGDVRQDGNTRDFIFPLDVILRYIARFMTLLPGDLIATGTPEGVGPVVGGDVVSIAINGLGTLTNPIVDESTIESIQ